MADPLTTSTTPDTTKAQGATKVPDLNFKEIVTAAIALAVVTTLIALLWWGFIKGDTLGDNQKYIIGIALSLAGTVTGYYFGRVPAEKRAETAERAENAAKNSKAKADAKVADAKQTIEKALFGRSDFKTREAVDTSGDDAWQELEALRRRLN